jgi:uncharacterized protein YpmB
MTTDDITIIQSLTLARDLIANNPAATIVASIAIIVVTLMRYWQSKNKLSIDREKLSNDVKLAQEKNANDVKLAQEKNSHDVKLAQEKNSTEIKVAQINKDGEIRLAEIKLAESKEKTKQAQIQARLPLRED